MTRDPICCFKLIRLMIGEDIGLRAMALLDSRKSLVITCCKLRPGDPEERCRVKSIPSSLEAQLEFTTLKRSSEQDTLMNEAKATS